MARPLRHGPAARRTDTPYVSPQAAEIIKRVESITGDTPFAQSLQFSPTSLTHVKRLLATGGTIVVDTALLENNMDPILIDGTNAQIRCFIDEPEVVRLAEIRRSTRAEIAVDYGLAISGPKLMVVGSAPAAINRMIRRRQSEPMSDVCVLAASTGFASVVQLKEKLIDSDLTSIVVRGKKGGIPLTITILNAILREIAKNNK